MTTNRKRPTDDTLYTAMMAASFAQEIGLPAGYMWEPAIARNILKEYRICSRTGGDWQQIEAWFRMTLGLKGGDKYWQILEAKCSSK